MGGRGLRGDERTNLPPLMLEAWLEVAFEANDERVLSLDGRFGLITNVPSSSNIMLFSDFNAPVVVVVVVVDLADLLLPRGLTIGDAGAPKCCGAVLPDCVITILLRALRLLRALPPAAPVLLVFVRLENCDTMLFSLLVILSSVGLYITTFSMFGMEVRELRAELLGRSWRDSRLSSLPPGL